MTSIAKSIRFSTSFSAEICDFGCGRRNRDTPSKVRFAIDSPLEGAGFELLVPLTQKSHAVWGGESPKLEAIAEHLPPKILAV
jgi:hypothetical protein